RLEHAPAPFRFARKTAPIYRLFRKRVPTRLPGPALALAKSFANLPSAARLRLPRRSWIHGLRQCAVPPRPAAVTTGCARARRTLLQQPSWIHVLQRIAFPPRPVTVTTGCAHAHPVLRPPFPAQRPAWLRELHASAPGPPRLQN